MNPQFEKHKFGTTFIKKKTDESICPFCKDQIFSGMKVILTYCCENYIHWSCCLGWQVNNCPCCGTLSNTESSLNTNIPESISGSILSTASGNIQRLLNISKRMEKLRITKRLNPIN